METLEAAIKIIKGLSATISWPITFLVCLIVFRAPVTNLINRITKAQHGGTSIEAPIIQEQMTSGAPKVVDELGKISEQITKDKTKEAELEKSNSQEENGATAYLQSFDNPLLKEVEGRITADLQSRKIVNPSDKEAVLTRALASTQLILLAERIYAGIWGSQVAVLRFLNGQTTGADVSTLRPFYEAARNSYPDWYREQTFDKWLGYLIMFHLVKVDGTHAVVTSAGRQFLRYMADTGKPERLYG